MQCMCGFTPQSDARFCPECGKKVLAPAAQDIQTVLCPNTVQDGIRTPVCRTTIRSSNKFCIGCGWHINPKTFMTGAKMCHGSKSNGVPCDNIVTPNNEICSECENGPQKSRFQENAVEKTILAEKNSTLISGNKNQNVLADQESKNLEFELVSTRSSEQEQAEGDHMFKKPLNLEKSSGNVQLANINSNLECSSSSNLQNQDQENRIIGSLESVKTPDGSEDQAHCGFVIVEHGGMPDVRVGKMDKPFEEKEDILDKNTRPISDSLTIKTDIPQENGSMSHYISRSKTMVVSTPSTQNLDPPQDNKYQNEGIEDDKQGSGTLATEIIESQSTLTNHKSRQKHQVVKSLNTLEMKNQTVLYRCATEKGQNRRQSENKTDEENTNKEGPQPSNDVANTYDKQEETKDNEQLNSVAPRSNEKNLEDSGETFTNERKKNEYTELTSSERNSKEDECDPSISDGNENHTLAEAECNNGQGRELQFIEVTFYVIVSNSCLPNQESDLVYLRFLQRELGGWKKLVHQMHRKEAIVSDIGMVYEGIVRIPKKLVQHDVLYLYVVARNGNTSEESLFEEYYFTDGYDVKPRFRNLRVPDQDTLYRFDGLVLPNPGTEPYTNVPEIKGIGRNFDNTYERHVSDLLKKFVRLFLPKWDEFSIDEKKPMEVAVKVDMLLRGLWENYGNVMKIWNNKLDEFKSDIGKTVFNILNPCIKEGDVSHISAIGMFYVFEKFDMALKHPKCSKILFRALTFDGNNKNESMEKFQQIENSFTEEFLTTLLRSLMLKHKQSDKPRWLYCLPLWHFVTKRVTPFEKAQLLGVRAMANLVQWETDEILSSVKSIKKLKWNSLKKVCEVLLPSIPMDYHILRLFMEVMKFEDFVDMFVSVALPPEYFVAAIIFYFNSPKEVLNKKKVTKKYFKHLIEMIKSKHKENGQITEEDLDSARITYTISTDLVDTASGNDKIKDNALWLGIIESFAIALSSYENMLDKRRLDQRETDHDPVSADHLQVFQEKRNLLIRKLKQHSLLDDGKKYLKRWNRMMTMDMKDGTIKTALLADINDTFIADINHRYGGPAKIIEFFCTESQKYSKTMQEALGDAALEALKNGCEIDDQVLDNAGIERYGVLLSKLFETTWNKDLSKGNLSFLEYTIRCRSFFHFLDLYYQHDKKSHHLKPESRRILTSAANQMWSTYEDLQSGSITVGDLFLLLEKNEMFLKIIEKISERDKKKNDFDEQTAWQLMKMREKEIQHFKKTLCDIQYFVDICNHFPVDTDSYDEALRKFTQLSSYEIRHLCEAVSLENCPDLDLYVPKICAFKIDHDILGIIPKLKSCTDGILFMTIWTETGNSCVNRKKNEPLTVDEVLKKVWEPVSQRLQRIKKTIYNGSMTFTEFEQLFGKLHQDNLVQELEHLSAENDKDWIDERIRQVQEHRSILQCVEGATVIQNVIKTYGLEGDFEQVDLIFEMVKGRDFQMCKLDRDFIKVTERLKKMSKAEAKCLQTLNNCKPVVDWLKKNIKTLQELKVFVDLASISAGEGAMEVAKVKCLHAATFGYSPMIFSLDDKCCLKILLEKCELVWKELASDLNLPDKLIDTNRQLDWLDNVKTAQGSVEVTSMRQAEAINSKGIYVVKIFNQKKHTKELTIEDVLQLHVDANIEGSTVKKIYKHKELQELQSKLMLVAGKAMMGNDNVEKFTIVFDSIVRLCKVFIKLVLSGCVLFTNWEATFLYYSKRDVCVFIKFGSGKKGNQIKGRRKKGEDVSTIIPRVAKFMEVCLEDWLKYIDHKRDEYQHLNFFTIDQMVILQKELVLMGGEVEPSDHIYPLLCIVKHDCTKMDLIDALIKAKVDVSKKEAKQKIEMEDNGKKREDGESEEENAQSLANFISKIVSLGYTENIAKEAIRNGYNMENIDEGIAWCMEQVDMETEFNENQVEVKVEEFEGWTKPGMSISTITQNILSGFKKSRVDTLIPDLEQLWGDFLSTISSSVSDYLSVEHLGIILRRLAETETFSVTRRFLPCFERGLPNLLLCPQGEILNTVLTIYSNDPNQPLPQSDEILMCTPHTTLDEVEIFWRRAVFDTTDRIHCLVSGDLLDYDVSDRGERRLDYHMQKATERDIPYKLVVVCSTEMENHSRIVAALDKYRRPPFPLLTHKKTKNYIKDKLTFSRKKSRVWHSAEVDFEDCTVRVIKSWRAGVGKTLYKRKLVEKLCCLYPDVSRTKKTVVSISLYEKEINIDDIMGVLLENTLHPGKIEPRLFHIDLSHEVEHGVDYLLFQLLILGCLTNSTGHVWRKLPFDLYVVESMPLLERKHQEQRSNTQYMHKCLDLLPDVTCRSPVESVKKYQGKAPDIDEHDQLFDDGEFKSPAFQRPFQYMYRLDTKRGLSDIDANRIEGTPLICLQTLLRHCGIWDPTWAELRHFVCFLNSQLVDFEGSDYISKAAAQYLPGFSQFVLRFLIQMSRDFATRSLNMSDESPIQVLKKAESLDKKEENDEADLRQFQLRRTWESSPHPYLFFNKDHTTMTFLGFNIENKTGNLVDPQTGTILEAEIMPKNLQKALIKNGVPINEIFDNLAREEKLRKLCSVMGIDVPYDPDPTYELTTDNVKKMLAIYMRFRSDIPVIIMGQTGCGKTRLVKFMCQLQCPQDADIKNLIMLKVHGGTCRRDIIKTVEEAERIAQENTANYGQKLYTVLFFDEANTTEAIGLIKEIMCDHAMEGEPLKLCQSLKIVAACNPYRKHSEDSIRRLEQAGLGYHVDAEKTTDRMGRVPMRRLVYRVQPLPQSMLPLVWDFGQLDIKVEEMYITQMVHRYILEGKIPSESNLESATIHILTFAQKFMKKQADECSFVSLRDVERVLDVMSWFYRQTQGDTDLFDLMEEEEEIHSEDEEVENEYPVTDDQTHQPVNDVTKSLVLALGVCYQTRLKNKEEFQEEISREFRTPFVLPEGSHQMADIITRCQNVFLKIKNLGANIAKNQALRENVFMMVVCIELRIPLFLVGKPGSSKSLAKTIVADAMQGNAAHTEVYRNYKQVQMVSFQCSPLSAPEGIVGTFRQCAMYQKDKDLNRFVSVVVLDEVGLAEDSPRMPLKTLHSLLEDGCQGDETQANHKKVAFIGISNWALDPAKMNRGIFVQREVPDLDELIESANGICSGDKTVKKMIKTLFRPLAESYLALFKMVLTRREFFGLRDFYSLIKMVYSFAEKNRKMPTWLMLQQCIKRNFGGIEPSEGENPLAVFSQNLKRVEQISIPAIDDPVCTQASLIEACLRGDGLDSDTRYLLLLTENYGALTVIEKNILPVEMPIIIFGSSFPSDQEYTQVCRNINRIKVCMETGNTVVLLNLENLYESLYDALNQYYVYFGGERYVDLGLGTHRVKCRVHKTFRMIVVAEKNIVYSKFPIPLINRLEKHFLNIFTMLSPVQAQLAENLEKWAKQFVKTPTQTNTRKKTTDYTLGEVFIGYHADTCASIILLVSQQYTDDKLQNLNTEVLKAAKKVLLLCATPDGVLRAKKNLMQNEFEFVEETYFQRQKHENLMIYLEQDIKTKDCNGLFAQVTTNSKLLTTADVSEMSQYLHIPKPQITLLTLQSFDTEQQFCRQVKQSFERELGEESLLIVQCDSGNENASLVACAQYCVLDQFQQVVDKKFGKTHIIFIIHLPRVAGGGFSGFQCGQWQSVHIDDLRPDNVKMPNIIEMRHKSVGTLLETATGDSGDMVEHTRQIQVDFFLFIKLTVCQALAMVRDSQGDTGRTTDRVKILLELIHQEPKGEKLTFIQGIGRHMAALMKKKEENMCESARSWLVSEATKRSCINRAGTFRKARNQCIIEKLCPILAGIIAQVDTNCNLDILIKKDQRSWEYKLWLEIINNPSATQIEYSIVVSPKNKEELPEVMVKGTGCDGQQFNASMPFSWLIYKHIDQILRTSQYVETYESLQERVQRVSIIIENLPIGKLLMRCLCEVNSIHSIKAYLSDFVHMVYYLTNKREHSLICQNLLNGVNMEFREGLHSVVMNFVAIHAVYSKTEPRLRNFASITRVWPDCSERIIEFQQKSAQLYLVTDEEMTLDVLGLYLLLKNLEPNKDSFKDQTGRQLWQKQVHKYRPVVERILGQFVTGGAQTRLIEFGWRCMNGIKEARCVWTKVVVMKLFLQHVCPDEMMPVMFLMTLWFMLKDNVDFKKEGSLEKVEEFLKMSMKNSVAKVFGRQENCKFCENKSSERQILLPCGDMICIDCYNDQIILETEECPVCYYTIPDLNKLNQDCTEDTRIKQINIFKSRCNSFFMDVVSQLCFSDDEPPSNQVIRKLMSYITATARKGQGGNMASKEMSVFEEGIDPTPVLRSFLLQHLLRNSSSEVKQCLEMYFEDVKLMMSLEKDEERTIELCLMFIQCLEDSFNQEVTKSTDQTVTKIRMATKMLQHDVGTVVREGLDVEKLYCMAQTRFGLTVVAEVLQKLLVEKSIEHSQAIRDLLEAAAIICRDCDSRQPKFFLIKHLCRCYGVETYQKICETSTDISEGWLSEPELQKNETVECSDRYIVCGDQYKELREKLTQSALGQDMTIFDAAVQDVQLPDYQKRTIVHLAVMREVTMSYLYPEDKRRITLASVEMLEKYFVRHPMFSNKACLPSAQCRNVVWKKNPQLIIREGMNLGHQSTVCLLNHFFITLLEIQEERTLVEPLNRLVNHPEDMQKAFLPTMPQDEIAEIKEALLAARKRTGENPVLYRCPNGHPYLIGNCGRPVTLSKCKDCGQEIGGRSYQLHTGNIRDQGLDKTATGHVLGPAVERQPVASPERGLSPIECAIVRLFTHMAMYLGASNNQKDIQSLIKPELDADNVLPFLWAHIEKDLLTIQKAVGRSVDDVYILIHSICKDIMNQQQGVSLNKDECVLACKNTRRKWEKDFAKTYLSPVLEKMSSDLKSLNEKLANDQRLGSDPLLCLLFEIDTPLERSSPCSLHNVAAVWRYRSQITMDHLLHTVQVQAPTQKVLLMFLQEEMQLRAIRLVPNIMKLQRLLIQKFQRKLDRGEALKTTIENMIEEYKNEGRSEDMRSLVDDFILAWQFVKDKLFTYTFPTLEGLTKIPKEFCQKSITYAYPVSVLLPTFRDNGLCAYGLLYYLLKKQNNFLQEYCEVKKIKYTELPKVVLRDVTSAHLISYHPDRDILPMVMANCHYTFQVGEGTKIDYNFGDLERQLMDRFLFSKSVIEMPVYEFEMMTYRLETTNAVVLRELRQTIKQEPLTPGVAKQICEETRAYPDLCETLDKVEITISFLKSVKGDPSMSLEKFMTQVLKMENPFQSQKARSLCQCKHAQSLWITLAMEKTRRQASHKQDAFEGVVTDLREELNAAQRDMITSLCEDISLERLDLLLEILFECIMLIITVPKGSDDDDVDMAKFPLRDTLLGYISAPQYDFDLNYPGWTNDLIESIPNKGTSFTPIFNNQAVDVWLCLYALYMQKLKERRY